MALGAIFGALQGLADFGEQRADASQQAADELYKRQAQKEQTQQFQTTQEESKLRMQELQSRVAASKNKIPYDKPFIANGKWYQRFQDPISGALTLEEQPGPLPETPQEQQYRAYLAIGYSPEQARDMVKETDIRTPGGTHVGFEPDPKHPGMDIATVYGFSPITGVYGPLGSYSTTPPASGQPTVSQTTGTDMYGNKRNETTIRGKLGSFQMPVFPLNAPSGPAAPQATTPAQTSQTPQGGGAPGPQAGVLPLDQYGNVPPQPGLNENIRTVVNDLRRNPDAPIPPGARTGVEHWMQLYDPTWATTRKLSPQERAVVQSDKQLLDQTTQAIKVLERYKATDDNSVKTWAKGQKSWFQYQHGFSPSEPLYRDLIKQVAAISIMGAAPWVRIGRGKFTLETIQQHLPKPTDTPRNMYEKLTWLRDNVIPSSLESITGQPSTDNPLGVDLTQVP